MERAAKARNTRFSESLLYRLDRFATKLSKAAESRLREVSGMSFSQFLVLMALAESEELKQAKIAEYVGVTAAVITKQVDQMAGKGWLQLGPAHNDRRVNVVRLTPAGRKVAKEAHELVQGVIADELSLAHHYRTKLAKIIE